VTIYDCIGKPTCKKADDLKPEEVKEELTRLIVQMHSRNILLEVLGQYELSVIYKFMTEELFREKIGEVSFPGFILNFVFEDFHPNHHVDKAGTAQEFLNHWFEKRFDENSTEFCSQLITAEGKSFARKVVMQKLSDCLNCYRSFANTKI
jgi:hypothetical protein